MATGAPAGPRRDTLGLRLALAFLSVALAAIVLLAGLAAAFVSADVSSLATRQRTNLATAVSVAAGAAWDRTGNWASADLSPVLGLAANSGLDLEIRNASGRTVASSPGFAASTDPASTAPIMLRASASAPQRSRSPVPASAPPTMCCGPRGCGPSPARPGWR